MDENEQARAERPEETENVVVGESGHSSLSEQQPQETGTSSAHPPEAQSGIGASGVPGDTGANGAATPSGETGDGQAN